MKKQTKKIAKKKSKAPAKLFGNVLQTAVKKGKAAAIEAEVSVKNQPPLSKAEQKAIAKRAVNETSLIDVKAKSHEKKLPAQTADDMITMLMGYTDIYDVWEYLKSMPEHSCKLFMDKLELPWKPGVQICPASDMLAPVATRLIAIGYVQNLWYRQHEGLIHDFEKLDAAQAERIATYKSAATAPIVQRNTEHLNAHKFQAKATIYKPTPALAKLELGGQQKIVQAWFFDKAHKDRREAGGTVEGITADIVQAGFKCNQDPKLVVYHYLRIWIKKGLVTG